MDQSLYYTFSTIAQTLGAAIAFLGAFVLYRLQSLNAEIEDVVTQKLLQAHFSGETILALQQLHAGAKHIDFLQRARSSAPASAIEHLQTPLARLEALVTAKSALVCRFRWSLWLTVAVIGFAVAVLALVPAVMSCSRPEWLLAVGVLAFVGCLVTYARLLLGALR